MTTKYIRRFLLGFVLMLVVIVTGFFAFRNGETKPVKVAIATWPGFASGFVGQERGYFEGLKIDFVKMDDSRARHAAFQSGRVDLMISSADVFAQERAQGIEGVVVLVTDESFGADGIVSRPEIKTTEELRGRKIAFARATPSHYLLFKALKAVGLSPKDVESVVVEDPGHAGQAFLGGKVDAAVTWEPLLSEVKSAGKGHVLLTTREMPGIIVDVLVASPDFAEDEERLSRFITGWMKSVQYIVKHPKDGARMIAKGLGIPTEETQGMMEGLQFAGPGRNRYFLCGAEPEPRLRAVVEDAGQFWASQEVISSLPNLNGSVSHSFCETWKQ